MLARNLKDNWSLTQKGNPVWAFFVPNNPPLAEEDAVNRKSGCLEV
jgi:hypothetical protein